MKNITAKQIAKQLNLSEAAVSMALHNKPGVSTKTRKRILDTARSLGYDFSKISANTPKKSGSIAIVFYNKTNIFHKSFFPPLINGIEAELKAQEYNELPDKSGDL